MSALAYSRRHNIDITNSVLAVNLNDTWANSAANAQAS